MAAGEANVTKPRQEKQYDYLLKFLLVGDSDVGKSEILSGLNSEESPFCSGSGIIAFFTNYLYLVQDMEMFETFFNFYYSLQDNYNFIRRKEGEITIMGHFRSRKILYHYSIVFSWSSRDTISL